MQYFSLTDSGPRKTNQDSILAAAYGLGKHIFAVADGVGGHFGGEEAARIATDVLLNGAYSDLSLKELFLKIHSDIATTQLENPNLRGMATTATAIIIDELSLVGAHCGDTRCIVQRGEGIRRLTVEHTEAQRLLSAGKLTKEEFINYPRRNILDSALGSPNPPRIDLFEMQLEAGDKIVVTSDGIHEKVRLREMLPLIRSANSPEEAAESLIQATLSRGVEDNYSVVVVYV